MAELFVISDTHFGQENILNFQHEGEPLRPFNSLAEMHIKMVDRWNAIVRPEDKVYHLGDVAFTRTGLNLLKMLNGRKRLVRGNHDTFRLNAYREHFHEVYGVRQIDGYWMTHVPMHPASVIETRCKGNIHGHLHANVIDGPEWLNVSVERIDYTPLPFDIAKEMLS